MPRSLAEIRRRAKEHEEEIVSPTWYTPLQLAARWGIGRSSVYEIPFEQLRYKEFGQGKKLKRRRYREDWVLAYEEMSGRSDQSNAHSTEAA
jgi:hypothetical protein